MTTHEHNDLLTIYNAAISNNIPDLSVDEFIKLTFSKESRFYDYPIPVLLTRQLSDDDIEFIREELPEVYDFMNSGKRSEVCLSCFRRNSSNFIINTIEGITAFYNNNRQHLRDIIIACIIEELLLGQHPIIHDDTLKIIKYTPVQHFHTTMSIAEDGTVVICGIISLPTALPLLKSKQSSRNIPPYLPELHLGNSIVLHLDGIELAKSKMFRFHQKVIAGILRNMYAKHE